jgi:hypothetical protein
MVDLTDTAVAGWETPRVVCLWADFANSHSNQFRPGELRFHPKSSESTEQVRGPRVCTSSRPRGKAGEKK